MKDNYKRNYVYKIFADKWVPLDEKTRPKISARNNKD